MSRPRYTEKQWWERFWDRIEIDGDHWLWRGEVDRGGYGHVRHRGPRRLVHRVVYELFVGPIPHGLTLDHLCRIRHCTNPEHLEPVTMTENLHRGVSPSAINFRTIFCKRGHLLQGDNVRVYRGRRHCLVCEQLRNPYGHRIGRPPN